MAPKETVITNADHLIIEVTAFKICNVFLSDEKCRPCLQRLIWIWKRMYILYLYYYIFYCAKSANPAISAHTTNLQATVL